MTDAALNEIIQKSEMLQPDEKLRLISFLIEGMRAEYQRTSHGYRWQDLCGAAPEGLTGEDAQQWISRSRQES